MKSGVTGATRTVAQPVSRTPRPTLHTSWGSELQPSLSCEKGKSIFSPFTQLQPLGAALGLEIPCKAADKLNCLIEGFLLGVGVVVVPEGGGEQRADHLLGVGGALEIPK